MEIFPKTSRSPFFNRGLGFTRMWILTAHLFGVEFPTCTRSPPEVLGVSAPLGRPRLLTCSPRVGFLLAILCTS